MLCIHECNACMCVCNVWMYVCLHECFYVYVDIWCIICNFGSVCNVCNFNYVGMYVYM